MSSAKRGDTREATRSTRHIAARHTETSGGAVGPGAPEAPRDGDLERFASNLVGPVWVTDVEGRMVFVNEDARALLGDGATPGAACHEVVRGYADDGRAVCCDTCPVRRDAAAGRPQRAWRMHVGDPLDEDGWVLAVSIPWGAPDAPTHLVHWAVDVSREQRLEEYVRRVAKRSGDGEAVDLEQLTPREREVLDLLARDIDPQAIARHLHLSHTTVRNHIQHILNRLDVHSTEEAVARWLLDG